MEDQIMTQYSKAKNHLQSFKTNRITNISHHHLLQNYLEIPKQQNIFQLQTISTMCE